MSQFNLFPTWEKEIFVFGSNLRGRHEAGAALTAAQKHGAMPGHTEGLMGSSYAIPTKDEWMEALPLGHIETAVEEFLFCAAVSYTLKFNVTAIGCGYAGYAPRNIAPLFRRALLMDNVYLPKSFLKILVVDPYSHRLSFDE